MGKYDADYLEEQYSEPESSDSVKTYDYTPNQPLLNQKRDPFPVPRKAYQACLKSKMMVVETLKGDNVSKANRIGFG